MASFYNDSEMQMDTSFILCIEEVDETHKSCPIDTRLFIGYDENNNDYFIRGRRQDINSSDFVPFAFHCETSNQVYDFIKFTMPERKANVILYNFNNTYDKKTNELTYEFFEDLMHKNYEISGFDNIILKRSRVVRFLRLLKNAYNWDNDN